MKRRSRVGRNHFISPKRKALADRRRRKRNNWTFERLEDRLAFSVAPPQITGISNDTPEGAAAIRDLELQWMAMQAVDAVVNSQAEYALYALPNDPLEGGLRL